MHPDHIPDGFGPLLGYCDHQACRLMVRRLRRFDVSPMQCRTLTYLHRQTGDVTQKMLQQHLMVRPSTVNGIVDRLEEKGLVTRSTGKTDGRCRILRLTEKGKHFNDDFTTIVRAFLPVYGLSQYGLPRGGRADARAAAAAGREPA